MQPEPVPAAAKLEGEWSPVSRVVAASEPVTDAVGPARVSRARAARSMLWSVVENGGLALVSFVSLIIYSRFLSAAEFGVFSVALAVVELFGVLVSMLFHDALVQREDVTSLHFDTAFVFTGVLSLALLAASALFAPAFARLLGNPAAAPVLTWTALCLPASALSATLVAQQRRELAFRSLALRSVIGRVSGGLVGIALVALGAGLWGLVVQQILIALLGSLVLWFSASNHPRLRFGMVELRQLLAFGAYAMGALFLTFAVKRVFVILAGVMLGDEKAGYLNLSFRAVDVLWAIAAAAVTQVALPVLSRLQSDAERVKTAYRAATGFTCLVLYPCFVGIAVVAPEVIELLFGRQWLPSTPYVTAMALLVLVQATRLLSTPMLTALGRPRDSLIGIAVEMAVMLAAMLVLGAHSLHLAVLIWVLREIAAAPVMLLVLRRAAGISVRHQLEGSVMPLLASAGMALAVTGVRRLLPGELPLSARLAVLVASGASAFFLCAWLLGRASLRRGIAFVRAASSRTT